MRIGVDGLSHRNHNRPAPIGVGLDLRRQQSAIRPSPGHSWGNGKETSDDDEGPATGSDLADRRRSYARAGRGHTHIGRKTRIRNRNSSVVRVMGASCCARGTNRHRRLCTHLQDSCTPRAASKTARKCWTQEGPNQRGLVYGPARHRSSPKRRLSRAAPMCEDFERILAMVQPIPEHEAPQVSDGFICQSRTDLQFRPACVRCCGSPRASSPHGLTAPGQASHDGISLRAVASGSRLLPTRPAKDFHLQSGAHARHTSGRATPFPRAARQRHHDTTGRGSTYRERNTIWTKPATSPAGAGIW